MADLTAAGTAHETYLAYAEGREVVVQHEALGSFSGLEQFDPLLVFLGAQRDRDQGLRFTASKQRGAMGARQDAILDRDSANLIERAAIRPAVVDQHFVAEDAFLERVVTLACLFALFFGQRLDCALPDLGH